MMSFSLANWSQHDLLLMNGLNGIDSGLSLQLLHNNEQVALEKYKYILDELRKRKTRKLRENQTHLKFSTPNAISKVASLSNASRTYQNEYYHIVFTFVIVRKHTILKYLVKLIQLSDIMALDVL